MVQTERGVPADQGNEILEGSIRSLDRARASGIEELLLVEEAKFSSLTRDRERLVAKLGEDHPRVQALDRNFAAFKQRVPIYQAEAAASSVTPPEVDERTWVLHGHVLRADFQPNPGVTVALYGRDTPDAVGYGCTDDKGYFQIVVGQIQQGELDLSVKVFVKEKQVYADSRPALASPGRIEYRRIVFEEVARADCDPPPGEKKLRKSTK